MNRIIKNIAPAILLTAMFTVGCREFDTSFLEMEKEVPEMTEPGLWVESETVYFDAGFNRLGFELRALGGDWTITPKEQYSHLTDYNPKAGGDGNFVIELEVLPNNSMVETDIIFVAKQENTNVTKEIVVKQYTHESKFNRMSDSLALLKIAEALNLQSWSPNNKWDPKTPITTWAGLKFEEIRGEMRVVELGMKDYNMWGEIAFEIGNLRELRVWNMQGSRIQGRLPSSISYLRNLHTINVAFSANASIFVPENMDNMKSLKILKVGALQFSFFENLYKLSLIEEFSCSGLAGEMKEGISNWRNLKIFNIAYSAVSKLPADMGSLTMLEDLNLSSCSKLSELPASIGELQNFKKLNVSSSGIVTLPENIGNLTKVAPFSLSNCKSLRYLPESFCNLPYTGELSFSGCDLLEALPNSIGNMKGITKLNLTGCSAMTDLPADMGTSIVEINLTNCKKMTSLPVSLCNMSQLKVLNVSSSAVKSIPSNISNLTSLENLNLNYSMVASLPASFTNLPALKILNMSSLEITSLPDSFGNLQKLEDLTINSTKITSLPVSFGNLISLRKLTISYPQSTEIVCDGSILSKLVNIETLSVSRCTFDGAGLDWMKNMTKATNIKVTESKMGGSLDWTMIPQLVTALDLTKNNITGTLGNIGLIPKKLTSITLSNNQISGDIPISIGTATHITRLILTNNNITGTIPEALLLTKVTGFGALDLNGNRMSGAVPTSVLGSTQWSRWKNYVITQQDGYGFSNVN